MTQGKLEVVKEEVARVNIDILGINELKWTGMGKFNLDDHYIWNTVLGYNLKNDRRISVHFQGKPFSVTVIQVYAPTTNAEGAEVEQFYEDL